MSLCQLTDVAGSNLASARDRESDECPEVDLVGCNGSKVQALLGELKNVKASVDKALVFAQLISLLDTVEVKLVGERLVNGVEFVRLDRKTPAGMRASNKQTFSHSPKVSHIF